MDRSLPLNAAPPAPSPVLVIRNRTAIAGWIFMAFWMGILVLVTWLMWRDGPHPSQPAWLQTGVLWLFWLLGIPVAGHILSNPCTTLRVGPDGAVAIQRRSVFTREVEHFPPGSIAGVECIRAKDDEGDPIWHAMLVAADGRERMLRESPVEADMAALTDRLRAALRLP